LVSVWSTDDLEITLASCATSAVLCGIIVGDSLKQKLDNLSDTVTDNVRGTGMVRQLFVHLIRVYVRIMMAF